MRNRATILFAVVLICVPAVGQALTPYSQDFEGMVQADVNALASDGWLVFGNVFAPDGTTYLYGYGPFPAPNTGAAFCAVAVGEGGPEQGAQQLVVFSDYENTDHALLNVIESNVFQEQTIDAANVGETWVFDFDAKLGNIELSSTAAAFIKTLDPAAGYALTNFFTEDMTSIPVTWAGYSLSIDIDAGLVGQILQIGFLNKATNYEGSGIFYDNVNFYVDTADAVPPASVAWGATLRQNYPNPFNPNTRIEFVLDRPGAVEISVFDLAGRRVATLHDGELGVGEHAVTWNGRTDGGAPVASGHYRYVLETATGRISRSMILLK